MGFIDKVKGFFYDEEEVEEEVEVPVKRELPKKKPIILDDEEEKKEIPERELFKAERTFNFPVDMGEEESDFTPIDKNTKEEMNSNNTARNKRMPYSANTESKVTYRSNSKAKTKEEQEKKFKPTPIISPIYGIIEGEYKQNDKEDTFLSKTKEFSTTQKIDFDTVREKAYGKVKNEDEEDNDVNEENKGIFFNLVDEEKEDKKEVITDDESDGEDDIKITYNDVDYDEEDDDEIEVPKITRIKKNKNIKKTTEQVDDDILSETKEQDLFNLIDNMYNSEEEDDE